jgi:hypothetical protein
MVDDGKGLYFDQEVENLVTPEAEKIFKCPKVRFIGVAVNGVPYEGW